MFSPRLLASVTVLFCLATIASGAPRLASDEVESLKQIGKKLGKKWNFSVDPCSGEYGWATPNASNGFQNAVTCNCSYSGYTICRVVSVVLKSQNLTGSLPRELVKLNYLQEIDLSRNLINGTIPPEWGSLPLVNISLYGNQVTGSIPKEFGNITTLSSLVLEFNQLSGAIPLELGNLSRIERMYLTSNYFSGELPGTLAKLTTLRDFRIGDNQFTGRIPSFLQGWVHLENLLIQASGLDGPIPPGIALLTNMSDLRISDLSGSEATNFPDLSNMKNLVRLILRSCNINGTLPVYLGKMNTLKTLDLSFNKLSGEIPSSFIDLKSVNYIYLTGNLLNGSVPSWILEVRGNCKIDLSYNSFSLYNNFSSENSICQQNNVNLFGSSTRDNASGILSCFGSNLCPRNWSSLHINCGGSEVVVLDQNNQNTTYEADTDPAGPSKLFNSLTNWAFSSTGDFVEDYRSAKSYIWTNTSRLPLKNSDLYLNARLSPLSLTYYGFCLLNGNYTVSLHFAEIMFTDDKTYNSLGRRVFDIYIQGKLVLRDFNIANEAGGLGMKTIKNFTAKVTDSTLEIRFYWAGKGTTGIPDKGAYGPLISAISVKPDFLLLPAETLNNTSVSRERKSMPAGSIAGIVTAVTFLVFLILGMLWWKGCLQRNDAMGSGIPFSDHSDLKGLDLQTGSFTLRQIKAATNNFDIANKIGEGGFGSVYKGLLSDGTVIAVKQLSSKSRQGNREFVNEIGMISALQHPHLVKLYGCCMEGNQLLLVYEYMENNSLARALFGPEEYHLKLDWPTRQSICIGIAKGLAYLHEESRLKIVHRDIKATNVLLDKNLNPKISDFGLAKLDEEEDTHISTRIAGTYGYMAPEYAMWGYLTDKADVYSFGVVALEIVSGRSAFSYRKNEDSFNLLEWALVLKAKRNLMELVDPRLESDFNKEEAMVMINVALLCTNATAAVRPTMSLVVGMLEGKVEVQELVLDQGNTGDKVEIERTMDQFIQYSHEISPSDGQIQAGTSADRHWTDSSSSYDLYPLNPSSEYWKRSD